MSQFGEPKSATSAKSAQTAEGVLEPENVAPEGELVEETLGQRRARLQKEREAGATAAARPPMLRSSSSLANLLAANPVGLQDQQKRVSLNAGGLLSRAERELAENKDKLRERMIQSNSSSHLSLALPTSAQSPARPGVARNRTSSQTLSNLPLAAGHAANASMSPQEQAMLSVQMQILQQQQMMQQAQQAQAQAQAVNPLAYRNFVAAQQQQQRYGAQQQIGFAQPTVNYGGGMISAAGRSSGMAAMGMGGYGRASSMNFGMNSGMMPGTGVAGHAGSMFASTAPSAAQTQHSQYLANMMRMAGQTTVGPDGAPLVVDPAQRAMIDRWRSSVAQ